MPAWRELRCHIPSRGGKKGTSIHKSEINLVYIYLKKKKKNLDGQIAPQAARPACPRGLVGSTASLGAWPKHSARSLSKEEKKI